MKNKKQKSAFTLIELSIVMVIIAVLVLVIVSSRQIVMQAKLQLVQREVESMRASVTQFVTTYGGAPGTLADAQITGDLGSAISYTNIKLFSGYIGPHDTQAAYYYLIKSGFLVSNGFEGSPATGSDLNTLYTSKSIQRSRFSKKTMWGLKSAAQHVGNINLGGPQEIYYSVSTNVLRLADGWKLGDLQFYLLKSDSTVATTSKSSGNGVSLTSNGVSNTMLRTGI